MIRIVSGRWRGRRLVTPAGQATRPTSERARETLFSMLVSRMGGLDELAVADLYAGSGALGLEALSRGAASALFVERDAAALKAIAANIATLGAGGIAASLAGDALRLPPGRGPFDLVLADPPYAPGSGGALVAAVAAAGWLAPGGWLAVESARGDAVDPGPFRMEAQRDVGAATLTLLSRPATGG